MQLLGNLDQIHPLLQQNSTRQITGWSLLPAHDGLSRSLCLVPAKTYEGLIMVNLYFCTHSRPKDAHMMVAACSQHTPRFNDCQPAHSPNEWLVSTRIGFGTAAAAPAFSSAVQLGFDSCCTERNWYELENIESKDAKTTGQIKCKWCSKDRKAMKAMKDTNTTWQIWKAWKASSYAMLWNMTFFTAFKLHFLQMQIQYD